MEFIGSSKTASIESDFFSIFELAAHCFHLKGEREKAENYQVNCMFGRYDLSEDNEEESVNSLVQDIVVHPEWNYTVESFHADISVIILFDTLTFNDVIQPVCLPQLNYEDVTGNGTVVGWGKSEHSGDNNFDTTPNKVDIPVVNGTYCYVKYPKLAPYSSFASFCGGHEDKGKAPCVGDSGGGFYVKGKCRWTIRGVVSGSLYDSKYNCDINKFALYTNVAKFVDWVENIVRETEKDVWNDVDLNCTSSYR